MTTTKSLKKLRSASTAFLDDGSSLLHGVDGLLKDIQRTLVDLQRREEILLARESSLGAREVCLDKMIKQLSEDVASRVAEAPSEQHAVQTSTSDALLPNGEATLSSELTEIQASVAEVVTPANGTKPNLRGFAMNQSRRFTPHRKKRRP